MRVLKSNGNSSLCMMPRARNGLGCIVDESRSVMISLEWDKDERGIGTEGGGKAEG